MKLLLGLCLLAISTDAADLVLLQDGKSDYQIVVPERLATESLNQTARLVQTAFKANGAEVSVVSESDRDAAKPSLYLGDTAFARKQAWVYVNGQFVRKHSEKSEKKTFNELWETPFTVEISAALLKNGKPNVLAVRVHNSTANGGIWRPVLVQGVPAK